MKKTFIVRGQTLLIKQRTIQFISGISQGEFGADTKTLNE